MKTIHTLSLVMLFACGLITARAQPADVDVIRSELERILDADQTMRSEARKLEQKLGPDSQELKELWAKQGEIDAVNVKRVQEILDDVGWPERKLYGSKAGLAVFLVIQHADLGVQKKYLLKMREAAVAGEFQVSLLALLEDRILTREGKRQIYGTQLQRSSSGSWELLPIEDEVNVDARRAKVGLGPIADYLSGFGITYTPPEETAQPGATDNPGYAQ